MTDAVHLKPTLPTDQNQLLALLPSKDRLHLLSLCEPIELVLSEVLFETDEPTPYVYFPTEGFISLVSMIDGDAGMEVGMVGQEGMLGVHLALGLDVAPFRALVQGQGMAWRIEAVAFSRELKRNTALRRWIDRYLYVLMRQLATASTCLRFHQTGQRLARWLLMSQDRAHNAHFQVTQEFLAYLLGVRRVGITTAAVALQRSGLIAYRRGDMTVVDRSGLEAAACSCYVADRKVYADIMQ